MVTWKDIKDFIRSNYSSADVEKEVIKLLLRIDESRSQQLMLIVSPEKDWLHILSRIGEFDSDEIEDLLSYCSNFACGGVCMLDGELFYRHSTLLADLSTDELVKPMEFVAIYADALEKKFVGGDAN